MAVYQSAYLWLTHRYRGPAPSHSCFVPGKESVSANSEQLF